MRKILKREKKGPARMLCEQTVQNEEISNTRCDADGLA